MLSIGVPAGWRTGLTLLRCILKCWIRNDVTASDQNRGSFGLYVGTDIGAQFSDPETDLIDWYWQENWCHRSANNNDLQEFSIDLRSARKLRNEDRTLFFVMKNSASSNGSIQYSLNMRALMARS